MLNEYNEVIREYFDISDTTTRKTIVALEDDQQTQLLSALSSALYNKIVEKTDKIDFGSIPRSRGDITKVEGFENTLECLNIIRRLVLEYKENPAIVDTVITAINNIKERKALFMKAFALNVDLPIILYNTVVLSIEQCVSFMISVCIQYIKDPESKSISSALDKVAYNNTRDNLLYEQLEIFNKFCLSKQIDSVFDEVIKNGGISESAYDETIVINVAKDIEAKHCDNCDGCENKEAEEKECVINEEEPKEEVPAEAPAAGSMCPACGNDPCTCNQVPVNGSCEKPVEESIKSAFDNVDIDKVISFAKSTAGKITITVTALLVLIKYIIPNIQNFAYYLFHAKAKFSDTLDIQAQFLEANVIKLEYSTNSAMTDDEKEKVIAKQKKAIDKLKKWSNFWAIKDKQTVKIAKQDLANDKNKYTTVADGIF